MYGLWYMTAILTIKLQLSFDKKMRRSDHKAPHIIYGGLK